jgi:hypothetical protein
MGEKKSKKCTSGRPFQFRDPKIRKEEKPHGSKKKKKINKGKTGADRRPLTMGGGSWYHAFATQGSDKGKARYLTRRYAKGVV